ncbi:hypothetical protein OHC33_002119 [Knufia fluminis]|uniref:Uncharacterized protein n=1 Tax=Knufia fluminis TaxID=191047 RepID=A0AAN8EQM2_9EURO|nr:hypothetical protein OHC33_002119 [Knufia fluminis]
MYTTSDGEPEAQKQPLDAMDDVQEVTAKIPFSKKTKKLKQVARRGNIPAKPPEDWQPNGLEERIKPLLEEAAKNTHNTFNHAQKKTVVLGHPTQKVCRLTEAVIPPLKPGPSTNSFNLPLCAWKKHPLRFAVAQKQHDEQLRIGWTNKEPTSLSEWDESKDNMSIEACVVNYVRSNFVGSMYLET